MTSRDGEHHQTSTQSSGSSSLSTTSAPSSSSSPFLPNIVPVVTIPYRPANNSLNFTGLNGSNELSSLAATNPIYAAAMAVDLNANQGVKRIRNFLACFFCSKSNLPCEEKRPCSYCIGTNMEKFCVGNEALSTPSFTSPPIVEAKKRVRTAVRKGRGGMSSSTASSTPATTLSSSSSVPSSSSTPSIPSSFTRSTTTPISVQALSDSSPSIPNNPIANITLPIAVPQLSFSRKAIPEALKNKEFTDTQMYLLNELFKLKTDHQRLLDEMQALKTSRALHPPEDPNQQKGLVVFDLTKKPATVLTADAAFCKMLGYDESEVLGAPWSKFVHPDYRERALNIFSSKNLSSSIELDQVYLHKNGAIVFALDVHTFLFGQHFTPVSDFVTVKLHTRLPSPTSHIYMMESGGNPNLKYLHPTPALTYPEADPAATTSSSSFESDLPSSPPTPVSSSVSYANGIQISPLPSPLPPSPSNALRTSQNTTPISLFPPYSNIQTTAPPSPLPLNTDSTSLLNSFDPSVMIEDEEDHNENLNHHLTDLPYGELELMAVEDDGDQTYQSWLNHLNLTPSSPSPPDQTSNSSSSNPNNQNKGFF